MFSVLMQKFRLWRYKRHGLQIAEDCRLVGMVNFGSEPYLISIGRHVTVANNVTFITHDGGTWTFRDKDKYKGVIRYGRITVKDNCFIGFGVTLLPGVTVGPNSVVGACSLVSKDIPPNSVAAGVPAKKIVGIEEYANNCLEQTPTYDLAAYQSDKVSELMRLYPRPW